MIRLKPTELAALAGLTVLAVLVLGGAAGWINGSMAAKTVLAVLGEVANMFRGHKG